MVSMRSRARRLVGPFAMLIVMISFLAPTFAPAHSLWELDRDCGPVTVTADHQVRHFEAVRPPVADEHCALCHWLRSIGGAAPTAALVVVPGLIARPADGGAADPRPLLDPSSGEPSRAPPVLV